MRRLLGVGKLFVIMVMTVHVAYAMQSPATVDVVSIEVETPDATNSGFANVNTTVKVKLTLDKEILRVKKKGTRLQYMLDDQGMNLLKKGLRWRGTQSYFTTSTENGIDVERSRISGSSVILPINVTAIPTKGAKTINIKGDVILQCYPPADTIRTKTGPIELPGGLGQVEFANYTAQLYEYGTGHHGGPELTFIKVRTQALIDRISFLDDFGKVIKVIDYPNASFEIESSLLPKVEEVNIEYSTPETVKVPIEISTGVGL